MFCREFCGDVWAYTCVKVRANGPESPTRLGKEDVWGMARRRKNTVDQVDEVVTPEERIRLPWRGRAAIGRMKMDANTGIFSGKYLGECQCTVPAQHSWACKTDTTMAQGELECSGESIGVTGRDH